MPTISACMIVKNEAVNLKRTLKNLRQIADQIVVVDTGSTDDTIAIAQEFADRVETFEWIYDFSAARNFSLSFATGDWILWADADEQVNPAQRDVLRAFLARCTADVVGVPILECPDGTLNPSIQYYREKLFRHHVGISFARPFNECPSRNGELVMMEAFCDCFQIHHWGAVANLPDHRKIIKISRNSHILEQLILKYPEDAIYHYMYANMVLLGENPNQELAISHYQKALQLNAHLNIHLLVLYRLAELLYQLKRYDQAIECCEVAISQNAFRMEFVNLLAKMLLLKQLFKEAQGLMEPVMGELPYLEVPEQIRASEYREGPWEKLGLAYLGQDLVDQSIYCFQKALEMNPEGSAKRYLELAKGKASS